MDVLFTFKIAERQKAELIQQFPTCTFHFKRTASGEEVNFADVIVTYGGNINHELLARAERLKWIMVASAGIEKMPLEALEERKILVTNVRGIHKTPMAESVLGHILALKRSIPEIYAIQETKEWKGDFHSTELRDSTALILGPGSIGGEIGRLLQAFGVRTVGCNRSGRKADYMDETITFGQLKAELPQADFVISVLPSTPETTGLLTAEHFMAMKDSAIYLNFGRGDVLNEAELIEALKEKRIHHAVLDVFQTEPLPEDSEFWTLPNCTVSPHVSSKSWKYIERALIIFQENLEKFLKKEGNFCNVVNLKQGY
ncbi:D-2-hydroxyacid dehydrogenase [Sporosarcina ureilytica]|uniref:D-2-hydroxyacid dehydrogenase n=1 Tax=Sporosarcina ureilytica TaxID=298596 RepID=A0A1D8JDT4_9BACL|nr:D-2-hydroxyacid dehydrogenase [Sporosarcina ureilytica]AOV06848.1 D-2-hydroxyacid dehydrogenase [Sporosarcina ureilytica]